MGFRKFLLLFVTTALAIAPQEPLIISENGANEASARSSAPQIFNALHSVMRQWGSSLNHNGLSFFSATIPAHTDFYHGRPTIEPVIGTEWLAFEIEHAEVFARNHFGGPRRPGHGAPGGNLTEGRKPNLKHEPRSNHAQSTTENSAALHHYRTTKILKVLLLDGMSAAKTSMGTLDQQDYVLCGGTAEDFDIPMEGQAGPPGDFQRATQMCSDFGRVIDGIVRMEAGFELILCNFSNGVEFISATPRPGPDTPEEYNELAQFEYLRGISYRYHGIMAGRVEVDYSNMVSVYFYDVNITNPDPSHAELPRLSSSDPDALARIKSEVASVLSLRNKKPTINWQGIVDLIVTRYSDRLQYMASSATAHNALISEINFLLNMYIDYSISPPSISSAVDKCTSHYLSGLPLSTTSDHFLQAAVSTVTREICTTLFSARSTLLASNSTSKDEEVRGRINTLTKYLSWTTWLECGKCTYDEVCFVAIWPFGGAREHEKPSCVKADEVGDRKGYWGDRGPGGGRPPGLKPENL